MFRVQRNCCLQIKRQYCEKQRWIIELGTRTLRSIILIAVHFTAIGAVMNYKKGQKRKKYSLYLSLFSPDFGNNFYFWINSRDRSSIYMTASTVWACSWMAIFNRWIDARIYQHALIGQNRVKLSLATVMLYSVSVAMAPGCHWVSGANPGGQTQLSDSPGTEMSSDAKVSQLYATLLLKRSHFVGQ